MRIPPLALALSLFTPAMDGHAAELHLRLGDIVAGGDGCGLEPDEKGINPRNGNVANPGQFAGNGGTGPQFHPANGVGGNVNYQLVDGVFTAHGTSVIDTNGGTFAFPLTQSGTTWDAIRKDVALVDSGGNTVVMQLDDQPGVNRDGIGMHTNCGVTFDLSRVRAAYSASTLRVEGVGGLNYESCSSADVEGWVIVDGVEKYRETFLLGGNFKPFSIPLTDNDRFLTIACTDQDQSDGCDHGVMADTILVIDSSTSVDCNGNFIDDVCELAGGFGEDCNSNGTPDDCEWTFTPSGVGCPGAGGFVPQLSLSGCMVPGGLLTLTIDNALGGSTALLFFGVGETTTPIPSTGCFLNMSVVLPNPLVIPLGGSGPGNGIASVFGLVPAGPLMPGSFLMQSFVTEPTLPSGFSSSAGLRVQVQ